MSKARLTFKTHFDGKKHEYKLRDKQDYEQAIDLLLEDYYRRFRGQVEVRIIDRVPTYDEIHEKKNYKFDWFD
ncbi:MAG: hypothetical protein LUD19_03010 [Clostridia bacterium]|nr:hypothetical protein [Clostridia bacterium]